MYDGLNCNQETFIFRVFHSVLYKFYCLVGLDILISVSYGVYYANIGSREHKLRISN